MKKLCSLSLFVLLVMPALYAQQLHINATRMIGGRHITAIRDIAYNDRDKSLIFCGYADSLGSGDLLPRPAYLPSTTAYFNMVVGKIDSSRNLLWIKMYGGTGAGFSFDIGHKIKLLLLPNGKIAIGGLICSQDFDGTGNHSDYGGVDYWLLMLDANGNKLWHKCFGGQFQDYMNDIKQTTDGGFIMSGTTNSYTHVGDVPFCYVNSQFTRDIFIVKTDSLGNKQWVKVIGGTDEELNAQIFQVGGSYYVAASSASTDHECNDVSWKAGQFMGTDVFLIKLDSAGNYLWNRSYGNKSENWVISAVWDVRDSTFILAGKSDAGGMWVPSIYSGVKGTFPWLLKLNMRGDTVWSKVFADTSVIHDEWVNSITPIPQSKGYLLATGINPNAVNYPDYPGGQDVRIVIIDSNGNVLTQKLVGGIYDEEDPVAIPYRDGFVVSGLTWGSPRFNEGAMINTPKGFKDGFISFLNYWPADVRQTPIAKPESMSVYPNPAGQKINVLLPHGAKGLLTLCTVDGHTIIEAATREGERLYQLQTKGLTPGNYIVRWQGAEGGLTKQITIR